MIVLVVYNFEYTVVLSLFSSGTFLVIVKTSIFLFIVPSKHQVLVPSQNEFGYSYLNVLYF